MPSQASESLVLRTYPYREADLIVSYFTRDLGKLRGIARRARKPKNSFGAGLERLSHVRMHYFWRENRDLSNLNSCDLIQSQFSLAAHYPGSVALDFIAEVSEHLLPAHEPGERFFRLLLAVLEYLRNHPETGVWPAVNYFLLWAVRLSGFLPEMRLSPESVTIAEEMMSRPIAELEPRSWSASTASDVRRILVRSIQDQVERKLYSLTQLEQL